MCAQCPLYNPLPLTLELFLLTVKCLYYTLLKLKEMMYMAVGKSTLMQVIQATDLLNKEPNVRECA